MNMSLKARVIRGRFVIEEPTDLPEGTEVELAVVAGELDGEDNARLHAAIDAADSEIEAGLGIPAEDVIAELRRNRS